MLAFVYRWLFIGPVPLLSAVVPSPQSQSTLAIALPGNATPPYVRLTLQNVAVVTWAPGVQVSATASAAAGVGVGAGGSVTVIVVLAEDVAAEDTVAVYVPAAA